MFYIIFYTNVSEIWKKIKMVKYKFLNNLFTQRFQNISVVKNIKSVDKEYAEYG